MVKKILVILIDGTRYEMEEIRNIMTNALYDTNYQAIITNKKTSLMSTDELIDVLQKMKMTPAKEGK